MPGRVLADGAGPPGAWSPAHLACEDNARAHTRSASSPDCTSVTTPSAGRSRTRSFSYLDAQPAPPVHGRASRTGRCSAPSTRWTRAFVGAAELPFSVRGELRSALAISIRQSAPTTTKVSLARGQGRSHPQLNAPKIRARAARARRFHARREHCEVIVAEVKIGWRRSACSRSAHLQVGCHLDDARADLTRASARPYFLAAQDSSVVGRCLRRMPVATW